MVQDLRFKVRVQELGFMLRFVMVHDLGFKVRVQELGFML